VVARRVKRPLLNHVTGAITCGFYAIMVRPISPSGSSGCEGGYEAVAAILPWQTRPAVRSCTGPIGQRQEHAAQHAGLPPGPRRHDDGRTEA
jgi:hypothetical protein